MRLSPLLAAALVPGVLLVPPTSTSAAAATPPVTVEAEDVVLAPSNGAACGGTQVTVTVPGDPVLGEWWASVGVRTPDGKRAGSETALQGHGHDTQVLHATVGLCGRVAGTYSVVLDGTRCDVEEYDEEGTQVGGDTCVDVVATTTFRVREAPTRTTLSTRVHRKGGWQRLTARVQASAGGRTRALDRVRVHLQVRSGGRWTDVPRSAGVTDVSGRESWDLRAGRRKVAVRVLTPAQGTMAASASRRLVIRVG